MNRNELIETYALTDDAELVSALVACGHPPHPDEFDAAVEKRLQALQEVMGDLQDYTAATQRFLESRADLPPLPTPIGELMTWAIGKGVTLAEFAPLLAACGLPNNCTELFPAAIARLMEACELFVGGNTLAEIARLYGAPTAPSGDDVSLLRTATGEVADIVREQATTVGEAVPTLFVEQVFEAARSPQALERARQRARQILGAVEASALGKLMQPRVLTLTSPPTFEALPADSNNTSTDA